MKIYSYFLLLIFLLIGLSPLTNVQAAGQWADGNLAQAGYVCTIMAGSGPVATYAQSGFWTDPATFSPKTGDVYYLHARSTNLMPCSNLGVSPRVTLLPGNTMPAVSANNPIRCFLGNINTGTVTEVTGTSTNFICPTGLITNNGYSLGFARLPPGYYWEAWLPVTSSGTLSGMATNSYARVTYDLVGDYATLEYSYISADAWLTVYAGGSAGSTPNVSYPPNASGNITTTTVRSYAQINNHYTSGTVYFDLGTSAAYGNTASGPVAATYDYDTFFADWSGLSAGTTYHWRARYVTGGQTYYGADQTFTTQSAAVAAAADVAVSITEQADPVALPSGGMASVRYTFTVTNSGSVTANNVVVSGNLPAGTLTVSTSSYSYATCNTTSTTYTCTITQAMPPGDVKLINLGFGINVAGTVTFNANVSTTSSDSNSANNSASVQTTILANTSDLLASAGPFTPGAKTVIQGSTNVVMQQLRLTAAGQPVAVNSITLQASGSGADQVDVTAVRLVHDSNNNGAVDNGETAIATGSYAINDGTAVLTLSSPLNISANTSIDLLVVHDYNNTLAIAALFGTGFMMIGMIGALPAAQRKLLVLVLLAWSLTSCGGGGDDTSNARSVTFSVTVTSVNTTVNNSTGTTTGLPLASATVTVTD